jgi:serine/threonine protein kinase/formylglycine-generating enzyme required for sulfatase activity
MSLIGQYIGRYHIVEQLGQGGMATVYKAYDTHLERDVAVKVIRTGVIGPDMLGHMLKRFEIEAKSLAKMEHPNIVNVHDFGEYEGAPYLVMQYVRGGTLKSLTGVPMPFTQAVELLLPISRALAYAHKRGVIHRDVKPANILITDEGIPMLSDFGIAKIMESKATTQLTGTGMGIGTPEYMSPEQWQGKVVPQTDIYSLGVMLYELVTGKRPYAADTPAGVFAMVLTEPLPRPKECVPCLPDEVEKVLFKALSKKPEERYENMGTCVKALENLVEFSIQDDVETRLYPGGEAKPKTDPAVAALAEMAQKFEESSNTKGALDTYRQALEKCCEESTQASEIQRTIERLESAASAEARAVSEVQEILPVEVETFEPSPVPLVSLPKTRREETLPPELVKQTGARVIPPAPVTKPWWRQWYTWVGAAALGFVCIVGSVVVGIGMLDGGSTATPEATAETVTEGLTATAELPTSTSAPPTRQPTNTTIPFTATPSLGIGSTQISDKDGMHLVYVPEGNFEMGTDKYDREKPIHTVYLDAFWIDQTEVTYAKYEKCVASGECEEPQSTKSSLGDSYYGNSTYADFPVIYMDWYQAEVYCEWAGRRLPTEAEWEKAARGTDGRTYPWGEGIDCSLHNGFGCAGNPSEVGSYPDGASPYGVLDMAGNVGEWVADWYDGDYYRNSPSRNPVGPSSGEYRVLRGGSWIDDTIWIRSAGRTGGILDSQYLDQGFRCASSAVP